MLQAEKGIPTSDAKSTVYLKDKEKKHKKHKEKGREHKKHKHRHKDRSKDKNREKNRKDGSGKHEGGGDHSKKQHEKVWKPVFPFFSSLILSEMFSLVIFQKRKHDDNGDANDSHKHKKKKVRLMFTALHAHKQAPV